MDQCKNCGSELAQGAKFCSSCGTKVETPVNEIDQMAQSESDRTADTAEQTTNQAPFEQPTNRSGGQRYGDEQVYQTNKMPYEQPRYDRGYPSGGYQPRKKNGMAIAGFVVSLAGMFTIPFISGIVGLILSIIGRNRVKQNGEEGEGLAVAGIIIGIVNIVLSILLIIFVVKLMMMIYENPYLYYDYF